MVSKETITLGAGLLMVTAGVFLVFSWENILENQVNKEFILREGSKTHETWKKTRIDMHLKFYFWNWTNPYGVKDPDYKPILVEMGPYAYQEVTEKTNVVWNANGTVSYRKTKRWYFAPEHSNGTEDDVVTTLNVVAKSAAFITRHGNMLTRMGLDVALSSTQMIHVSKPVRELLFEGYKNTLIDTAQKLPAFANLNIPFDRFGWFYKRNGSSTADGVFNVETGINGMENFGVVRTWNYKNHTPYFDGECGAVRGSGGDFFPPKRTKEESVVLFSPDLCRSVAFTFAREMQVYGMTVYRYELTRAQFDNGKENPENTCYCAGDCSPPGALNVSSCRLGAPAFVSFPHFLDADPSYAEGVVGMKPDKQRHSSHFVLEPRYGIPLDIAARFQINILMQSYPHLSMYAGLKTTYFPVMWFEQAVVIPEETVKAVKMLLVLPTVGTCVAAILLVAGTALLLTAVGLRYCRSRRLLKINGADHVTQPMMNGDSKRAEEKSDIDLKYDTKL